MPNRKANIKVIFPKYHKYLLNCNYITCPTGFRAPTVAEHAQIHCLRILRNEHDE